MSYSDISDEGSCDGRELTADEFMTIEFAECCNSSKINSDLIAISNRDLHKLTVHTEFRKFVGFIKESFYEDAFGDLLKLVFCRLYFLILCNNGKSDADEFYGRYRYLFSSSDDLEDLLLYETSEDVQNLLRSEARIKVRLPKRAYTSLLRWLKDNFTDSSDMFNISRVLHENFRIVLYTDDEEEAFYYDEQKILEKIQSLSRIEETQRAQKKSKLKADTSTKKAPSKAPKKNSDEDCTVLDSSTVKLKKSAKAYLEKLWNSGISEKEMDEALSNPPDFSDDSSSESSDHVMDSYEEPVEKDPVAVDDVQRQRHYILPLQHVEHEYCYFSNFHRCFAYAISGKNIVCSSDISSDLLYMAVGFENCKIRTFHLLKNDTKFQPIGTLIGHEKIACALAIDSNRRCLVSGSHDNTVKIWDIEKSICMKSLEAHSAPVLDVCISPNSKYFLTASEDRKICMFWFEEVYPMKVFCGHTRQANTRVRFHPNGAYFASSSTDGDVFLFKITSDNCPVRMFHKHRNRVYALTFSRCGKHLATGDLNGDIIIWELLDITPFKCIYSGQGVRDLSYDISGKFLIALVYGKSWKVFDVEGMRNNFLYEIQTLGIPRSLCFTDDNSLHILQYTDVDPETIMKQFMIVEDE